MHLTKAHYTCQTLKTTTGGCRADFKLAWGVFWQNALPANTSERKHTHPGDGKRFVRKTQPTECKRDTGYLSQEAPSDQCLQVFCFPLWFSAAWTWLSAARTVMEAVLVVNVYWGLTIEAIVPSEAALFCPFLTPPPLRAGQGCETEAEKETSAAPGSHWHCCTHTLGRSTSLLQPTSTYWASSNWESL